MVRRFNQTTYMTRSSRFNMPMGTQDPCLRSQMMAGSSSLQWNFFCGCPSKKKKGSKRSVFLLEIIGVSTGLKVGSSLMVGFKAFKAPTVVVHTFFVERSCPQFVTRGMIFLQPLSPTKPRNSQRPTG